MLTRELIEANLHLASSAAIFAESGRRLNKGPRGSVAKLQPCPTCGTKLNTRERRVGCECGQRWHRSGRPLPGPHSGQGEAL